MGQQYNTNGMLVAERGVRKRARCGSKKELGAASLAAYCIHEFGRFGFRVGEIKAVEASNLVERPGKERVARPAIRIDVAFVVHCFVPLLVMVDVEPVLKIREVLFPERHYLGAGVVESCIEEVYAAAWARKSGHRDYVLGTKSDVYGST